MATVNQVRFQSDVSPAPAVGVTTPYSDGSVKTFLRYCLDAAGWTIGAESSTILLATNAAGNAVIRIQNDGNTPYTSTPILSNSSFKSFVISFGAPKSSGSYATTDILERGKDFYLSLNTILAATTSLIFWGNENSFCLMSLNTSNNGTRSGLLCGNLNSFDTFKYSGSNASDFFVLLQDIPSASTPDDCITALNTSINATQTYCNIMTDVRGIQGWHNCGKIHSVGAGNLNGSVLTYPNYDGNLDLDRVILVDNGQRRGYFPGIMGSMQSVSFANGDTCSTNAQSITRNFEFIKTSSGGFFIETTNHWNE